MMKNTSKKKTIYLMTFAVFFACNEKEEEIQSKESQSEFHIVGAMKNVMWKGEIDGTVHLDTISNKSGLFGLGPLAYLRGEVLINNGKSYVSKVTSDSTMRVDQNYDVKAPFFVYANVKEWNKIELPHDVKTIQDLEKFIDKKTTDKKRPFAFKLKGVVSQAVIHIQNLPKDSKVSSPKEAHAGQINYVLKDKTAEILGFFSTEHQGVFTHHDSYLHMHLITEDKRQMGHLDEVEFKKMKLYLPKE